MRPKKDCQRGSRGKPFILSKLLLPEAVTVCFHEPSVDNFVQTLPCDPLIFFDEKRLVLL